MAGKGSKRRPSKSGAYESGYDGINWAKKPTPLKDIKSAPTK